MYKSSSECNISGRGLVKVVSIPVKEKLPIVGEIVKVDDEFYKLRGIEMMKLGSGERRPVVGLLVSKVKIVMEIL